MSYRLGIISCIALVSMCWVTAYAHADIGKVGSPVVPSNLPKTPKPAKPAVKDDNSDSDDSDAAEEPRTPLLVIAFGQKRVYFEKTLAQAIKTRERAQVGTEYDLVSRIPGAGGKDNERLTAQYSNNLDQVAQAMQDMGVQGTRIHMSTEVSKDATVQEVTIYTN